MQIIIMRHGEAEAYCGDDASRELTARGREDARNAGLTLLEKVGSINHLWVSPYVRTQQTADEVATAYPALYRNNVDLLISHDQPARVVTALGSIHQDETILLISHNPLVSLLVGYLVDGQQNRDYAMQPASIALINSDDLLPGCADLQWLRHPPTFSVS